MNWWIGGLGSSKSRFKVDLLIVSIEIVKSFPFPFKS